MLIDENGTIKYQQGFVDEVIQYFSSLFNRQQSVYDRVLQVIPLCVNDDDNMLSLIPDSDGLNQTFSHNFWDHCAKDVFEACKMLLDNEALSPNFNDTNIVLLPIGRDSKPHQRLETCTTW